MNFEEIAEAVARGWCHSANEKKDMDADLAYAITQEIAKLLQAEEWECLGEPRLLRAPAAGERG